MRMRTCLTLILLLLMTPSMQAQSVRGWLNAPQTSGRSAGQKPTCNASVRNYLWLQESDAGSTDTFEVCLRQADASYRWVRLQDLTFPQLFASGSVSLPGIAFTDEPALGIRRSASGIMEMTGLVGLGRNARAIAPNFLSSDALNGHVAYAATGGNNVLTTINGSPVAARVTYVSTGTCLGCSSSIELIRSNATTADGGSSWTFTPVHQGDSLGFLSIRATRNSSGSYTNSGRNGLLWQAREDFSDTNQGTEVWLTCVDIGSTATVDCLYLNATKAVIPSTAMFGFAPGSSTVPDAGISRPASAVVEANNGTIGALGAFKAALFPSGSSSVLSVTSNTIAPTNTVHHVGSGLIKTITVPAACTPTCSVMLVPDAAFTTDTTGNISLASTAVVNRVLIMVWDGTKWNPSY